MIDPTETWTGEWEYTNERYFWDNEDFESVNAKVYVKELEAKISSTKKELTKLKDYFKTTNQILLTNELEGILKRLQ